MLDLTLRGQYERAARLLRSGDLLEAAATCHRILESFPKHIDTYSLLGQISLEMGNHKAAASLFRRVLSADPEHTVAYASLSAIYAARGLLDEAIWSAERALEGSPSNREIRQELLRLYRERDPEAARLEIRRGPLARMYLQSKLYPKAIGELRDIVALEPYRYDLRVALAVALWRDGQGQDASTVCDGILADLPNCLKANLLLGAIWLNTEKDEKARALLLRAQALDPDNRVAQTFFGADSPLPPRTARLPFRHQDVPPLDLPYLSERDDAEAQIVTAESASKGARPRPAIKPPEIEAVVVQPATKASDVVEKSPKPEGREAEPELEKAGEDASHDRGRVSLLVIKRQYLVAHPNEHTIRLELARLLRDIGDIDSALKQYKRLILPDLDLFSEVRRDLELLNRLAPGDTSLLGLLVEAREASVRGSDSHRG